MGWFDTQGAALGRSTAGRALLLALALLLQACAGSAPLHKSRNLFYNGQPDAALDVLESESIASRDRLLQLLDTGLIQHTAGYYEQSSKTFITASKLLDEIKTIRLSEAGVSLVSNEWAETYTGEYSERLWLHTFQMMNFLLLGKPESAAVEARQALAVYADHGGSLKHDWFSRALLAMSFEAAGQYDSAHIEYKKLFNDMEYAGGIARLAWQNARRTSRLEDAELFSQGMAKSRAGSNASRQVSALGPGKDSGELILFLQSGAIPHKIAGDILVSDDLRTSFPIYPEVDYSSNWVTVSSNNNVLATDVVKTRLIDISRAALSARGKKITTKQVMRLAAKKNISQKVSSENELLGAIVSIMMFALEEADTRSWETLPAHLSLVQIVLPSGTHDLDIELSDSLSGTHTVSLKGISIRAGRRTYHAIRVGAGAPVAQDGNSVTETVGIQGLPTDPD